jgi:hypothetical protein
MRQLYSRKYERISWFRVGVPMTRMVGVISPKPARRESYLINHQVLNVHYAERQPLGAFLRRVFRCCPVQPHSIPTF